MSIKYPLRVLPIESASECQFYTKNTNGENVCYVKALGDVSSALAVMERSAKGFDPLSWSDDCGGSIERCSFLPILFESGIGEKDAKDTEAASAEYDIESCIESYLSLGAEERGSNGREDFAATLHSHDSQATFCSEPLVDDIAAASAMTRVGQVIASFDPFLSEADAEAQIEPDIAVAVPPPPSVQTTQSVQTAQRKNDAVDNGTNKSEDSRRDRDVVSDMPIIEAVNAPIVFKIFGPDKFKKPHNIWQVGADVIVIPANSVLSLPDKWLHKMSRGNVQTELDQILRSRTVSIGQIFQTSNGGDFADGVQAKRILHAVLAAETWVSNAHTITQLTPKCLFAADAMGAKTVVMTPFDCGTVDIEMAARAQLTSIRKFIYSNKVDHVESVFIIMSDTLSYDVFMGAYKEIFYGVIEPT